MADHEPTNIASEDTLSGRRSEARAARIEGNESAGDGVDGLSGASDAAAAASEPMAAETTLSRGPGSAPVPPGRTRSGDPPSV